MMELLLDPAAWAALVTLTALEIVLASTTSSSCRSWVAKLPAHQRHSGAPFSVSARDGHAHPPAAVAGMGDAASATRCSSCSARKISGRDLILFFGGLFLIAKATMEIHSSLEGPQEPDPGRATASISA